MPGVRAFRTSPNVGSIHPGNTKGGCYSRRGVVREQRLNFLYESFGS
jgi:hypothetical protein